jgi:hypothetical protein
MQESIKDALAKNPQASTLVNVFVNDRTTWLLLFSTEDITVTGTPVKITGSRSVREMLAEGKNANDFCLLTPTESQFADNWNALPAERQTALANEVMSHGSAGNTPWLHGPKVKNTFRVNDGLQACTNAVIARILAAGNSDVGTIEVTR